MASSCMTKAQTAAERDEVSYGFFWVRVSFAQARAQPWPRGEERAENYCQKSPTTAFAGMTSPDDEFLGDV